MLVIDSRYRPSRGIGRDGGGRGDPDRPDQPAAAADCALDFTAVGLFLAVYLFNYEFKSCRITINSLGT